ncbi:MAG: GldM family protein [Bacteroidales bacterium]|nr:GldM family protein [Bacteroidales bacterium]
MKDLIKNAFFILLLFIAGSVYSQTVVSTKNNSVYAGISNPISIAVDGIHSDFIEVTCENAKLEKQDGVNYQITPKINTREVKLSIYNTKEDEEELISKYSLRVLRIPAPEIMLANIVIANERQEINRNILLVSPILVLRQKADFIFDMKHIVTEFTIAYKIDSKQVRHKIDGYKIPANIITELRKLPANSEVEFLDITYKVSNTASYTYGGVKVILK